ncbi:MAG: Hsp70 family protein [Deltaproteobacteria bacterium]|nr:Hsp70 family protein [Deltaproteobacteria bacterium]
MSSAPVVGIDLGTSNSSVAAFFGGKHQIIPDVQGHRLTPSIISFGKDKMVLVGHDAKAQIFANPKKTISSIKRLIGRKIFSPEVKKAQTLLPFKLVEGADQNIAIEIDGQLYSPQEISAMILRHMKDIATKKFGEEVTEAVITVPAHFNDNQRQATKDACKIAGLDALRIINEPTAAALAYGFGKGLRETVAIYDLGGGTFDLSILTLKDQVFEVIATAGDTFLGGDDFDDRIIDLCAENFLKRTKIDLRAIPQALPILRSNAEKAKRRLSYAEKTDIYIPGIVQQDGQPIDLQFTLSREIFRESTQDLIQRTFTVCDEGLRTAGLKASELDAVILVGGPTKMSLIFEAAASYFGKMPLRDHNPDEVVALGASIQAQGLTGTNTQKKALLLDVTPLDLGIATVGGYTETIVEANSPIPIQASEVFTTTRDNQETVNIRIFQGKNRREEESSELGEFEFSGFKKAKAGLAAIEVFFSINSDGIVEVSAKDKETGTSAGLKVKLSATMDEKKLSESTERSNQHREVQLKSDMKDAQKVVICVPSVGGHVYEDGFIRDLDPKASELSVFPEGSKVDAKKIETSKCAWFISIEDFANIPRYIEAVTQRPAAIHNELTGQLYQFKLKDGSFVFGQVDLPKLQENGFWIQPYFPHDQLPGKLYLYSSMVQESQPVNF